MKKLISLFISTAMMAVSSLNLNAQIIHSHYTSTSASIVNNVVVSNPNSYVNYMVGSDITNKVFVSELDYSYPTPQQAAGWSFQLPANVTNICGQVTFTNGMVHPNTDEIFVYGYGSNNNVGVFAIIRMVNGTPATLSFRWLQSAADTPYSNSRIESACWASHPTNLTGRTAYGIVFDGKLARVLAFGTNIILNPTGYRTITGYNIDKITSVAYDANNNNFIVSVASNTPVHKAVAYIANDGAFAMANFTSHLLKIQNADMVAVGHSSFKVYRRNNPYYSSSEVYLVHEIYDNASQTEGFWITNIDYLSGNVNYCEAVMTNSNDVSIIDVADNFSNLYVLAEINGNKAVLQTDMYSFTSNYCATIDNYVTGISYNEPNMDVVAFGREHLAEVFDASYTDCGNDVPVNPSYLYVHWDQFTFTYNFAPLAQLGMANVGTANSYTITGTTDCGDYSAKSANNDSGRIEKIMQIIEENKLKYSSKDNSTRLEVKNQAEIQQFGDKFICNNFEGENCRYKIIDIFGRTLQEGYTQNYVENKIGTLKSGIYIICVTDESNTAVSHKIIISE